jgi:ribosomal protein S24E
MEFPYGKDKIGRYKSNIEANMYQNTVQLSTIEHTPNILKKLHSIQ